MKVKVDSTKFSKLNVNEKSPQLSTIINDDGDDDDNNNNDDDDNCDANINANDDELNEITNDIFLRNNHNNNNNNNNNNSVKENFILKCEVDDTFDILQHLASAAAAAASSTTITTPLTPSSLTNARKTLFQLDVDSCEF